MEEILDLFDAIKQRHSYRGPLTDQPIQPTHLRTIVEAGISAPSGKNAQTTQFIIITDPEIISRLNALHPANPTMNQATAMIACVIDCQPEKVYEGYDFQLEDCAAATENMLLAITALGYVSVWIDGWLRVQNRAEKMANILNIPKSKKIQIVLPIGVAAEQWQQKERLPFEQRACYNTYTLAEEK